MKSAKIILINYIFIILGLCIQGCNNCPNSLQKVIIGEWELVEIFTNNKSENLNHRIGEKLIIAEKKLVQLGLYGKVEMRYKIVDSSLIINDTLIIKNNSIKSQYFGKYYELPQYLRDSNDLNSSIEKIKPFDIGKVTYYDKDTLKIESNLFGKIYQTYVRK